MRSVSKEWYGSNCESSTRFARELQTSRLPLISRENILLVRLMGGLGNQMFQFACGRHLADERGLPLVVDRSLLGPPFGLGVFGIDFRFATASEVEWFNGAPGAPLARRSLSALRRLSGRYPLVVQHGNDFDPRVFDRIRDRGCIVGRWQSERFFSGSAQTIRSLFTLQESVIDDLSREIACQADESTMAIHVRRGDLVADAFYARSIGALSANFYRDALSEARRRRGAISRVVVFSDEPEWCLRNLRLDCETQVVQRPRHPHVAVRDLWTLSQFRTIAISNSTFGWWSAWLGQREDSLIIVPSRFTRSVEGDSRDIWPAGWVKLACEFEPLG